MTTINHDVINYEKRKNSELFKGFLERNDLNFSTIQNYIPIYSRFFSLNPTNYNSINLNNKYYIHSIQNKLDHTNNIFTCNIKKINSDTCIQKNVFFKFAPLIDPFKYLIGKYDIKDETLFTLPKLTNHIATVHPKLLDENNTSYVDAFFSFLISKLKHNYDFVNGLDYYGSFIGIKNKYAIDVIDDIEYLIQSDFFNKNKNVAFEIEDYSFLLNNVNNEKPPLAPIKIDHTGSAKSGLSVHSIQEDLFEDLFSFDIAVVDDKLGSLVLTEENIKEHTNVTDLVDITHSNMFTAISDPKTTTIHSGSTCSSRTSYTSDSNEDNLNDDIVSSTCDTEESYESETSSTTDSSEQHVEAIISKFPVNVICMENCEDTFDSLILRDELTQEQWIAIFMQIIMTLITYQKCFSFTHNDLHTNNIMYINTNIKFLYYCYNKKYYKVPTFGKIFKIIDFGRSIYKFDGKVFCSDSFQTGGDAATQYNTEPYFNEKKPRLEPNYSFDLCRLACSIFDYLIDDLDEVADLEKCSPTVRLIYEWCLDDNGLNILYKNNGAERYPDFKLYKMIARYVHYHTPQAQLEREIFKSFLIAKKSVTKEIVDKAMDIDKLPVLVNHLSNNM
jgi:hypothetical protein